MKQCPNCGAQIADDSRFCTECGKEIPQGSVCPHCGASVGNDDAFCQNCGKSLDKEIAPSGQSQNTCPHCGASMNEGDVFCQECGMKPTDVVEEQHEETEEYEVTEGKSGFKKYLPYILGVIVVLCLIGYCNSKDSKGGDDSLPQTEMADSVAADNESPITDGNSVIADFDENMVYQGEYVFDAVLTDATLEKTKSTFTIKIDGNKVSIPTDEGKTMTGFIYNDDLGIDVLYDYGDDLHWISMSLKPNDREGKEWIGEYSFTGMRFDAVLKLKEVKRKGEAVKVTEERTDDSSDEEISSDNPNSKYVGRWSYYIVSDGQKLKVHTAIINSDMSARWITYLPDGSVNTSMDFRQCVFADGYVYFTDNGDITAKMTPRFKVGSGGLEDDGDNIVEKE